MHDKPIRINERTWQNVKEAVERVQAHPHQSQNRQAFHRAPVLLPYIEGVVVSPIGPFNTNSNTYGVGQVQPYSPSFDANSNTYTAVADNVLA